MFLMQIFCIIYYICSYLYCFPAIVKLVKTKSSNDYSVSSTIMGLVGTIAWTVYIFCTEQDIIVYIGSFIDLVSCCVLDFLVLKYYKRKGTDLCFSDEVTK